MFTKISHSVKTNKLLWICNNHGVYKEGTALQFLSNYTAWPQWRGSPLCKNVTVMLQCCCVCRATAQCVPTLIKLLSLSNRICSLTLNIRPFHLCLSFPFYSSFPQCLNCNTGTNPIIWCHIHPIRSNCRLSCVLQKVNTLPERELENELMHHIIAMPGRATAL